MSVSDAKKASNAAWDAANMAYQTVKVRREILDEFRAACAARGDKVNTVLREAMEAYTGGTLQRNQTETKQEPLQRAAWVMLSDDDAARAKAAAEASGETVKAWLARAVKDTADRDEAMRRILRR